MEALVTPKPKFNHTVFESLVSGLIADSSNHKCRGKCEYCQTAEELMKHEVFEQVARDIAISPTHGVYLVGTIITAFFQLGMKYSAALRESTELTELTQGDEPDASD